MTDLFASSSARDAEPDPRPVLVGMNNPLSSSPEHALYPHPLGCTGHRTYEMLHDAGVAEGIVISRSDYIARFDRRNVLSRRTWSSRDATLAGRALMDELSGRRLIVLGVETCRALGMIRLAWGEWGEHYHLPETTPYCLLPHPSGRCREYNDPAMRLRAGRVLLRAYLGA